MSTGPADYSGPRLIEAARTLAAPRWELWLARMFGTRYEGHDGCFIVHMVHWRGRAYFLGFTEAGGRDAA